MFSLLCFGHLSLKLLRFEFCLSIVNFIVTDGPVSQLLVLRAIYISFDYWNSELPWITAIKCPLIRNC